MTGTIVNSPLFGAFINLPKTFFCFSRIAEPWGRPLHRRTCVRGLIYMTFVSTFRSVLSPMRSGLHALAAGAVIAAAMPTGAAALTQSWNGYRWARTGPLVISVGNNLTAPWSSMLAQATTEWSAANNIDFVIAAGKSTSACAPVYGGVQICNSNYGANGWLGWANVWLSSGFIVQATVRLNDYYFAQTRYNTTAWRRQTICQELGHTLGLAHTNTIKTNLNTGSCMDYTNDPSGTAGGVNGTLANLSPNSVDFAALDGIYATLNATQLTSTKPTALAGEGFSIDDHHHGSFVNLVPEPGSWLMLIAGFGGIGAALRRQRRALAA